jgi:excisionase family DNA binding protein
MTTTNLPDFLTMRQTADELHCHPDTVAALIRRGELKAVHIGRAVRVLSSSIQMLPTHGGDASFAGAAVSPGRTSPAHSRGASDGAHSTASIPADACSHIIRAIAEEMERENRLAFLGKRAAEFHQVEVLRQQAVNQFARINGWTPTDRLFSPAELGMNADVLYTSPGVPTLFDHPMAFTRGGMNVALVGQPYSCSANAEAFRRYADKNGLDAHVPPNRHASFWFPPNTLFLVVTLPFEVVRWLPEQEESAL